MLNLFESSKLSTEEKIKEKYKKKANIKIAKDNAVTEFKSAVLENKQKLIPEIMKIRGLKSKLKEPQKRKRRSNLLLLIAIIMTVTTTCVSVIGGVDTYSNIFSKSVFTLFMVCSQLLILIISSFKPWLANRNFNVLLIVSTSIQLLLLTASISYNFKFLYNPETALIWVFVALIMCILFDVGILVLLSISTAYRMNYMGEQKSNNLMFSRFVRLFGKVVEYKITNIENSIENKLKENDINDLEIKRYLDFAKDNISENNRLMSYKDIGKSLDITESKAKKIHKNLLNRKIIKTENKKTYLVN